MRGRGTHITEILSLHSAAGTLHWQRPCQAHLKHLGTNRQFHWIVAVVRQVYRVAALSRTELYMIVNYAQMGDCE